MKYDCKECINNKNGNVFHRNKQCSKCTVDSKNIFSKPSCYKKDKTRSDK